jgi:hypothetical protein
MLFTRTEDSRQTRVEIFAILGGLICPLEWNLAPPLYRPRAGIPPGICAPETRLAGLGQSPGR